MHDLIVIGSGPGGYIAAERAAELGMKVLLIERYQRLGGTCLNVGCIPSKVLLHDSEISTNFSAMMKRKEEVVKDLTISVATLMRQGKVEVVIGHASLKGSHTVEVEGKRFEATHILLATGSKPIELPFLPFDKKRVLSSTDLLSLNEVPRTLVVVGGGVIGLELASVFNRLGSKVTIIEMLDRIIPNMEPILSRQLQRILEKEGIEIHTRSKVLDGAVTFQTEGKDAQKISAEKILVAVGRRAYTEGLGLKELGIKIGQSGQVIVNDAFQTAVPSIRAIGDLIDGPMLAHKASYEAVAAVELMAGLTPKLNYVTIPNIVYTHPEVAAVGLMEEEARSLGLELMVGSLPMRGNARARCRSETEGLVKVVGDRKSGKLIGVHLLAEAASELIASAMIAIEKGATVKEFAEAPWGHPTLGEALKEAALVAVRGSASA